MAGSAGRVLRPTEGVAEAVGRGWVVALGAGMLQQLWEQGGVCGSWGCGMGVSQWLWVQGELLWRGLGKWGCGATGPVGLLPAPQCVLGERPCQQMKGQRVLGLEHP